MSDKIIPYKVLRTEVLSYLMTKAEFCSDDFFFKVKKMKFMGYSNKRMGYILGYLRKDGLVEKMGKHTPSVWRTNLVNNEGDNP